MSRHGVFGRSWLWWLVVVFVVVFVVNNPQQAAGIVRHGFGLLMTAGEAAVTFLQGVFQGLGRPA